jgi:hypothetical protein
MEGWGAARSDVRAAGALDGVIGAHQDRNAFGVGLGIARPPRVDGAHVGSSELEPQAEHVGALGFLEDHHVGLELGDPSGPAGVLVEEAVVGLCSQHVVRHHPERCSSPIARQRPGRGWCACDRDGQHQ